MELLLVVQHWDGFGGHFKIDFFHGVFLDRSQLGWSVVSWGSQQLLYGITSRRALTKQVGVVYLGKNQSVDLQRLL